MTAFESREKWVKIVILLVFCLLNFLPVYTMIMTPLRPPDDLLITSLRELMVPSMVTFDRFSEVLGNQNFRGFFMNSLIVATLSMFISITASVFGGYALARLKFWGKEILARLILLAYVIAPILLVTPMFVLFAKFHLQDTYWSLILAHISFGIPFSMWLLRGFFMSLPKNLEEAARIDGATFLGTLFRVVLPLAMPGVTTAAMFVFVLSWNDYLFALVFISRTSKMTLSLGIATTWMNPNMEPICWCRLLTASLLSSLPIIIMFLFLQKAFIKGMTAGAVKG